MTSLLPIVPDSRQGKKGNPKNHLQALLDGFCDFSGIENDQLVFKGLSINSKKVHEDYLFLACAGSSINAGLESAQKSQHGIAYAGDAINRGASCVLWEPTEELETMPASCPVPACSPLKEQSDVPMIAVARLHEKVGEIAARFYGHPSHAMGVTGITGTNGKTSCAHFIAQMTGLLDVQNRQCAIIGTLGNGLYGQLNTSTHTTPDAVSLQAMLSEFKQSSISHVVMEVSSHALAQGRVNSVEFDTAVFTNLTRDHLDYHGSMQRYAEEKLKLFHFPTIKHCVLNLDDSFTTDIIASVSGSNASIVTYSKNNAQADYFARDIILGHEGIEFVLCTSQFEGPIKTQLVGEFNIDNVLATIAVLHQQGYELKLIVDKIQQIQTVPGRMEKIFPEQKNTLASLPLIVIDYAHTPDALEKGLTSLRAHTSGQLICLFGCGGDRDKGKRPLMARVSEQLADQVMITSDNPRHESPEQIIDDILQGFVSQAQVSCEIDRTKAIHQVLENANRDDVILIAGKGHEDYQEIKGKRLKFSDSDCVKSFYQNQRQQDGQEH
jgi:UDP-N-acetylmuramoyl-L-alanyl-D-glutamate--2,6-diaminopimelate ligase